MLGQNTVQSSYINSTQKAKNMTEKEQNIEWILISDAAEIMNMHVESVRRICRDKEQHDIRCKQLYKNGPWMVAKADAEKYVKVTHKNT